MANVTLMPMPKWVREVPARMRPGHHPIFDADPTPQDIELARALFLELDRESQAWYAGSAIFKDLLCRGR